MDWTNKNKWASLVATLVSVASVANAQTSDMQVRNLDNRVTALEQRKGMGGVINPSVNPQVKDGLDLDISGEFLYWKAGAANGFIGQQMNSATAAGSYAEGREINLSSNWAPGFRVGIGYILPHDGWDLRLDYTRIRNSFSQTDTGTGIFPIVPTPVVTTGTTYATSVTATGKQTLNMIDLSMGRSFYTSKDLSLRPFIGIRNIWLKQAANATYTGGVGALLGDANNISVVNATTNNWHIGMRAGLDSNWNLGAGFSIYGKTSAAILYGNLSESRIVTATDATSQSAFYKGSRFVADIALGFAYDILLADDTFGLQLSTGWNQFFSNDLTAGNDSYNYQGWSFAAKLSF